MNTNKIIFLDFDGVITTLKSKWCLEPSKMALIGKIIEATDCAIVISSSWRLDTIEDTINERLNNPKHHYNNGLVFPYCDRIIGITDRLYNDKYRMSSKVIRGVEINKWLVKNTDGNVKYIIIDDDDDMLPEQQENFIHTDWELGISEEDVEIAIQKLNSDG